MVDKKKTLLEYDKNEYREFIENDNTGEILKLLDEEGLKLFSNYKNVSQRIEYTLAFSKYKNELLQKSGFLDLFLDTDTKYYLNHLSDLDYKTYDTILERCTNNHQKSMLLMYFNEEYVLKVLDDFPYSINVLYELLEKNIKPKIINKIIKNYPIDLTKVNRLDLFIRNCKETVLTSNIDRNLNNKDINPLDINIIDERKNFLKGV